MSLENILTTGIRNLKRSSILLGLSLSVAFSPMVIGCDNNNQTSLQECRTDDDCKGDRICNPYTNVCEFPEKEPEQEEELELCCGEIISIRDGRVYSLDLDNKVESEWNLNLDLHYNDGFSSITKSVDNSMVAIIKEWDGSSRLDVLITDKEGNSLNQYHINWMEMFADYEQSSSVGISDSGFALIDNGSKLIAQISATFNYHSSLVIVDLETMQPIVPFEGNSAFPNTPDSIKVYSFTVSPDEKIYFSCDHEETGDNSLYVMDNDGNNKYFLNNTSRRLSRMYWVPFKNVILAVEPDDFYFINPSFGDIEPIIVNDAELEEDLIISPNGDKFISDDRYLNDFDDEDNDTVITNYYVQDNDFECINGCWLNTEDAIWLP